MSSFTTLGDRGFRPDSFPAMISPSPRRDDAAPAIDLASLLRRCMDDAAFCGMILHKFAARCDDQLAALERALASGNAVELAREAHTLQGVAANLSAVEMRTRADELERAARAGDLSAARKLYDATRSEVHRCQALVPELIARVSQ